LAAIRALRAQGVTIGFLASVKEIDDEAFIITQGQENSQRRDLSFLEQARFAQAILDSGYTQDIAAKALTVTQPRVSLMSRIARLFPDTLLDALGPCQKIGRDRWERLTRLVEAAPELLVKLDEASGGFRGNSNDRFAQALLLAERHDAAAKPARPATEPEHEISGRDGITRIARLKRGRDGGLSLTIPVTGTLPAGFADRLQARLAEFLKDELEDWQKTAPGKS